MPKRTTKQKPAAAPAMTQAEKLLKAGRDVAASQLPKKLKGVSGITVLTDASGRGVGEPGKAVMKDGMNVALVMNVDVPSLCVDAEGCAHDVVCHLADLRAVIVKNKRASGYGLGRLSELMRRLNASVERLRIEAVKLDRKAKKA
jgi:hypothetical protein